MRTKMLEFGNQNPEFYADLAKELYNNEDWLGACENLIAAYKLKKEPLYIVNLAEVYMEMHAVSAANEILHLAFKERPYEVLLIYNYFWFWNLQEFNGNHDTLRTTIANCKELFKDDVEIFGDYLYIDKIANRFEEAFENLFLSEKMSFHRDQLLSDLTPSKRNPATLADYALKLYAADYDAALGYPTMQKVGGDANDGKPFTDTDAPSVSDGAGAETDAAETGPDNAPNPDVDDELAWINETLREYKNKEGVFSTFEEEEEEPKSKKGKDEDVRPILARDALYGETYLAKAYRLLEEDNDVTSALKNFLKVDPRHPRYVTFAEDRLLPAARREPKTLDMCVKVCRRVLETAPVSHMAISSLVRLVYTHRANGCNDTDFFNYLKKYTDGVTLMQNEALEKDIGYADQCPYVARPEFRSSYESFVLVFQTCKKRKMLYFITKFALTALPTAEIFRFNHAIACKICGKNDEAEENIAFLRDYFPFSLLNDPFDKARDISDLSLTKEDYVNIYAADARDDVICPAYSAVAVHDKEAETLKKFVGCDIEKFYDFHMLSPVMALSTVFDHKNDASRYYTAMPTAEKQAVATRYKNLVMCPSFGNRTSALFSAWLLSNGRTDYTEIYFRLSNNGFARLTREHFELGEDMDEGFKKEMYCSLLFSADMWDYVPDIDIFKRMATNFTRNSGGKCYKMTKKVRLALSMAFYLAYRHLISNGAEQLNYNWFNSYDDVSLKQVKKFTELFVNE